jgi:uncharacterized protein (DUF924 family)
LTLGPRQIIDFWFAAGMEKRWFRSTEALDSEIRERFQGLWQQAAAGKLDDWTDGAQGALAMVIVLDQFPLNMFRGEARSFSTGALAVKAARDAVARRFDQQLQAAHKGFLYMPLMHSEDLMHQDEAVRLFGAAGLASNARFARHHRALIRRFGRFPHRNKSLGRASTPEELAYLASSKAFTG